MEYTKSKSKHQGFEFHVPYSTGRKPILYTLLWFEAWGCNISNLLYVYLDLKGSKSNCYLFCLNSSKLLSISFFTKNLAFVNFVRIFLFQLLHSHWFLAYWRYILFVPFSFSTMPRTLVGIVESTFHYASKPPRHSGKYFPLCLRT